ncbi:ATP-binding protein [Streptomyces jumonjinensis]|uniref:ATP-binding protein n=1 Tax=Streptomyces jumonjinensis TaxID=1945 RepID=A0A646KHN4_STRJU|nr:ATP-binding protein [Streptomyces jumonjinensis]MQT01744.1 ATP-binding protein [Streptomyces jumonjinensis]
MKVHQIRLPVPGTHAAAASARRDLVAAIRAWDTFLQPELLDTAELVASELITNAVRHAGDDGPISACAHLGDEGLRIEVIDMNTEIPEAGLPGTASEAGRGLFLVAALVDRYGFDPLPSGKRCWAEFEVSTTLLSAQTLPMQRS